MFVFTARLCVKTMRCLVILSLVHLNTVQGCSWGPLGTLLSAHNSHYIHRTFLRSQPTKWQWRVTPTRPQSVRFDQMSDSVVDGKGTIVTAVIDLPPNRVGRNTFRSRTPVSAFRAAPSERFDLTLCCGVRGKGKTAKMTNFG